MPDVKEYLHHKNKNKIEIQIAFWEFCYNFHQNYKLNGNDGDIFRFGDTAFFGLSRNFKFIIKKLDDPQFPFTN